MLDLASLQALSRRNQAFGKLGGLSAGERTPDWRHFWKKGENREEALYHWKMKEGFGRVQLHLRLDAMP